MKYALGTVAAFADILSASGQSVLRTDNGTAGPPLEEVHYYYSQWPTGVAVSSTGRIFTSYLRGGNPYQFTLGELVNATAEHAISAKAPIFHPTSLLSRQTTSHSAQAMQTRSSVFSPLSSPLEDPMGAALKHSGFLTLDGQVSRRQVRNMASPVSLTLHRVVQSCVPSTSPPTRPRGRTTMALTSSTRVSIPPHCTLDSLANISRCIDSYLNEVKSTLRTTLHM